MLDRTIEHRQRYRLVVGWDTVDDHMVHFRESEGFRVLRGLVGSHLTCTSRVEHVERVIEGFEI